MDRRGHMLRGLGNKIAPSRMDGYQRSGLVGLREKLEAGKVVYLHGQEKSRD